MTGRPACRAKTLLVTAPLVSKIDVGCQQSQAAIGKHRDRIKLPSCRKLRQRHVGTFQNSTCH
jgi:hypothetical protein